MSFFFCEIELRVLTISLVSSDFLLLLKLCLQVLLRAQKVALLWDTGRQLHPLLLQLFQLRTHTHTHVVCPTKLFTNLFIRQKYHTALVFAKCQITFQT